MDRVSFSAPRMKVSEFSETFFVACISYEKWARRQSDKVLLYQLSNFIALSWCSFFGEKGIFAINLQVSVQVSGCDCKMIARNHLTT